MAIENEDALRRLLADRPRPRLPEDFSRELMRRVRQQQDADARQHGVGTWLVLGVYWLAALLASAWILRQGPLPDWATALLWAAGLLLVPASYAVVLWSSMGSLGSREGGI